MLVKNAGIVGFKALPEEGDGVFEAIVAVFNNVDRGGDRILPGAFKGSLERWAQKGRPIPVIFSHEWDNLDAHIGEVVQAEERDRGLYVKARLYMEEEFATRVWKRLRRGTLAEFSFAYDIIDARVVPEKEKAEPNHYQDLIELDVLEVGPCLVGMNPETELLTVKEGRRNSAKDSARIQSAHDLLVELGAKCVGGDEGGAEAEAEDGTTADGKARAPMGVLQARVALALLEDE